jgi:hypothetical protein
MLLAVDERWIHFFLANSNDEYVWLQQYHRRAQGVVTKEEFPINNIWSISLDIATMDGRGVAPLSEFTNHKVVTKSMVRFPGIGLARRRHTLHTFAWKLQKLCFSCSVGLCNRGYSFEQYCVNWCVWNIWLASIANLTSPDFYGSWADATLLSERVSICGSYLSSFVHLTAFLHPCCRTSTDLPLVQTRKPWIIAARSWFAFGRQIYDVMCILFLSLI